jgi:hypothetical protein
MRRQAVDALLERRDHLLAAAAGPSTSSPTIPSTSTTTRSRTRPPASPSITSSIRARGPRSATRSPAGSPTAARTRSGTSSSAPSEHTKAGMTGGDRPQWAPRRDARARRALRRDRPPARLRPHRDGPRVRGCSAAERSPPGALPDGCNRLPEHHCCQRPTRESPRRRRRRFQVRVARRGKALPWSERSRSREGRVPPRAGSGRAAATSIRVWAGSR